MDDPHFDHKSAKRFDRQRASGPFGVDEILPKKIHTWVNRKHPDTGKRQTLLNFVGGSVAKRPGFFKTLNSMFMNGLSLLLSTERVLINRTREMSLNRSLPKTEMGD